MTTPASFILDIASLNVEWFGLNIWHDVAHAHEGDVIAQHTAPSKIFFHSFFTGRYQALDKGAAAEALKNRLSSAYGIMQKTCYFIGFFAHREDFIRARMDFAFCVAFTDC